MSSNKANLTWLIMLICSYYYNESIMVRNAKKYYHTRDYNAQKTHLPLALVATSLLFALSTLGICNQKRNKFFLPKRKKNILRCLKRREVKTMRLREWGDFPPISCVNRATDMGQWAIATNNCAKEKLFGTSNVSLKWEIITDPSRLKLVSEADIPD